VLQFNSARNRSFTLMAIALACLPVIDNATAQDMDPLALVPAPDATSDSAAAPGLSDSNPQLEEKVTLDFRATPLGDVLRTLAEQSAINIVIGRSVNQSELVTLRLSDVTYRTAMQTILQMNGLDAQTKDNILRVDSIERVTTELAQKKSLKLGEWNSQPSRVMIWQLNYASAATVASLLEQMIKAKYIGLTNLSVTTDARTNKLMIESIPEVLERAKTFIQVLDKRKRQVLIEARIVEASRELSRSLGVNWGTRFAMDGRNGLSTGLVFPNSVVGSIGGAGNVGQASPNFSTAGPAALNGSTALSIGSINSLINLDAVITAYETESMANIISSPRIVVEDQDTANINETTRKTSQVISGQLVINNSANYELSLTVTPKITNDGNIQMAISVNRGTPGSDAPVNGVETSTNRSAKTNLSVGDGETAVIGGLYQSNKTESVGRIPILGDLPLIGWLFRARSRGSLRTELMVLITPRLVKEKGDGSGGVAESGSNANSMLPVSSSNALPNNSLNNSSLNNSFSNNSGNNFVNNGSLNSTNTTSVNPTQTNSSNPTGSTPNSGNNAANNSLSNNNFSGNEFSNNEFSNNEFSNENTNNSLSNNSGNSSNSGNF
jgi:type IV pilus assembly protein PilQ